MKNPSVKAVVVLLSIAIVCVSLLAILNDLLYVPPDMSIFSDTVEGEYTQVDVKEAELDSGSVSLVVTGTTNDGKKVVGLYATGVKSGKADPFTLAVIIDLETNAILGVSEVVDGSTGGYSYDESKLATIVDAVIIDANTFDSGINNLLQTGATNSSYGVMSVMRVVAQYYSSVYMD